MGRKTRNEERADKTNKLHGIAVDQALKIMGTTLNADIPAMHERYVRYSKGEEKLNKEEIQAYKFFYKTLMDFTLDPHGWAKKMDSKSSDNSSTSDNKKPEDNVVDFLESMEKNRK